MNTKTDVVQLFVLRKVVLIKIRVFWVVTPRRLAVGCRHFEGACCSHLQGL